MGAMIGK